MNKITTHTLLTFLSLLLIDSHSLAQFEPDYSNNYFDQKLAWRNFYDSLYQQNLALGDSSQGEGFNRFNRWVSFWEKVMPGSGSFSEANEIYTDLLQQKKADHFKFFKSERKCDSYISCSTLGGSWA